MAVFAIPGLLSLVGAERFGFLALAWGLIGYAGSMDLGIGRAVTQRVSVLRSVPAANEIPEVVATAVTITAASGLVGMLVITLAASLGAGGLIQAETVSSREITVSMLLLALALPLQAMAATFRGVNEAYLNFRGINILRTFLGIANFGAPYLVATFVNDVHWLVATLVLSRLIALLIYRHLAYQCMCRELGDHRGKFGKLHAAMLLKFGGWFSVSSIVGPLMVQSDRFFVGALISAGAVTLYVIPYEVTTQALIFTGALNAVIFPVIANLFNQAPEQVAKVFHQWLGRIVIAYAVLMALLAYWMPNLLEVWVGSHVTLESVRVGQVLCIGVLFNSVGAMYFSLLHAKGLVRQTAVLHLLELPLYLLLLVTMIGWYGIVGCAIAWVIRAGVDAVALIMLSWPHVMVKETGK
jgi:O-antigen/teichoic acid export membrane protein